MFHNLDQLRLQIERENLHGVNAKTCLQALRTQFQGIFLPQKGDVSLLENMDTLGRAVIHRVVNTLVLKRDLINPVQAMAEICVFYTYQVVTECSETKSKKHVTKSIYGNDTHAADANMKLVNDKELMAEVQLTAAQNVLANEQQHSDQSEPIYDIHLLEKVDSNTTPDSTNMSHRGGEINRMLNTLCLMLSLSKQKICVAKLLEANEQLHKENEHLKQTYKELYDSIIKTVVQNKDNSDSLISQINQNSVENADLKAHIQEKGKPPLKPSRNRLVVRQPNAFTSERPRISRLRFASQIDEKNDLSKTVTPHYLPKVRESAAAKPHQVNAPNYSRNSHKESYGSNDMVHAYFLEDARKMTQDKTRIPNHRDMASTRAHCTPNACTPKLRNIYRSSPVSKCSGGMSNGEPLVDHSRNSSFFLDSKKFVCSICHKYIFNTNHDDCITKILNKVNSRAKVQSPKIRNNNPVEPKNHTHKPGRQNGIGQRFSLNKSSAVHEKPHTPRSCLRWKPTGRIFKTVSLRWIPTGKVFIDSTTKVDSEPPNGSNDDITNPYECNQTLYVSAGTSNSSAAVQASGDYCLYDVCSHQFRPVLSSVGTFVSKRIQTCSFNVKCIRWQKRIFLHLNLQDEMNRSFIAQNSYRLERETFSKIYRSCRRILSSTFQLIFQAHKIQSSLHDNIVPKPDLALELGKSISLTEAEEEAVAREVHATYARIVSGPDPEPMQEDQTGSNSGKLHIMCFAGPTPEHVDDEFLAKHNPKFMKTCRLIKHTKTCHKRKYQTSHSGSMSSMKNLDDTYNFGDQFLYDKPTEDDQEKSKVIEESDSTLLDPSHQTVTSTPLVIAPFTDVSSTKPSSLVTPPSINTEATNNQTHLSRNHSFIALQLRWQRLEQEMSEVKEADQLCRCFGIQSNPKFYREITLSLHWPKSIMNQESKRVQRRLSESKGNKQDDSDEEEDDDYDEGPSVDQNQGNQQKREKDTFRVLLGSDQHPHTKDDEQSLKKLRKSLIRNQNSRKQYSDKMPMQDEGQSTSGGTLNNAHIPRCRHNVRLTRAIFIKPQHIKFPGVQASRKTYDYWVIHQNGSADILERRKFFKVIYEDVDSSRTTGLYLMTPGYISSGLVQNSVSPTNYVPPSKRDYEILFQPLFIESIIYPPRNCFHSSGSYCCFSRCCSVVSPSSTNNDQHEQSTSNFTNKSEIQSQVLIKVLAPHRKRCLLKNVSSGLVPLRTKGLYYDNSDPVPPRQNVVPTAEKTDSSQQGLEFLFSPLLEEYYNPTHGQAEENNNNQAPNASFQEDEFINPFCTWVQEIEISIITSSSEIQPCQFKKTTSLPQIRNVYVHAHGEYVERRTIRRQWMDSDG
ncbi:hypothetical protein Tco_0568352 [Tanacetum coccineum]